VKKSWLQFARLTHKLELQYRPKIIAIIKDYRKDFINDLQNHGQHQAIANLQKQQSANLPILIQTIYKSAGLTGAKITADEIKASVKQKAAGFGRNEQWIRDVINYLKTHLLDLVQNITETMRQDIVKILQKGIDEQLSIDEIVRNLQSAGLIEARANVIARTEIVRAANVGHSVAARSFPYEVNKKWSAAMDHRTRHSHVFINAHMVDENDFFKVPDYKGDTPLGTFSQMLYPGDAEAPAAQTINCRCRVIYVPKRDTAGNLIMRDTAQAPVIPMRQIPSYTPAQIAAILKANVSVEVKK
jgi:uncharacterized protein with gpF-like domain